MTPIELKEYLHRVYQLEQSLFQQKSLRKQVQQQIRLLENYEGDAIKETTPEKLCCGDLASSTFFGGLSGGTVGGIAGLFAGLVSEKSLIDAILWELGKTLTFAGKGFLVGAILGISLALLAVFKGKKKTREENKQISEENDALRLKNAKIQAAAIKQCGNFKKELQKLNQFIHETEQILSRYYSIGIIFPKYQEFIAISSFYEYLASGRCSTLEGHEGAYNIFESESRQDLILRKLDDIISRLDCIAENQYMLYTAIQSSNRETNRLISELKHTIQSIDHNTAIAAYNTQITAQNTEYLKWLATFRI